MARIEELLPEFKKGTKIRCKSWKAGEYIYIDKKGSVMTEKGNVYILDYGDFDSEYWELYQEPIDWDYIIKNKCLCWFWGGLGKIKYLNYLQAKEEHTFRDELGSCWDNCRPVRRDEVNFYENEYLRINGG